jgi:hypothetical protein
LLRDFGKLIAEETKKVGHGGQVLGREVGLIWGWPPDIPSCPFHETRWRVLLFRAARPFHFMLSPW